MVGYNGVHLNGAKALKTGNNTFTFATANNSKNITFSNRRCKRLLDLVVADAYNMEGGTGENAQLKTDTAFGQGQIVDTYAFLDRFVSASHTKTRESAMARVTTEPL